MANHTITIITKTSTRLGQRRPAVEASCTCWAAKEFKSFDQSANIADAKAWRTAHRASIISA